MEEKSSIFNLRFVISLVMITIGAVIAAAALELVLIPNMMIDGGINGVGIITNKLIGGPLGLIVFILNIPFLILGYSFIGEKFVIKSGYSMLIFSILLEFFGRHVPLIDDTLLATVYGGIALGIGVGLIIKEGGCLDGTEVVAVLINRKGNLSVGQVVFMFNIFIREFN